MSLAEILGSAFLIFGTLFSALGVIGILRLPDTYSRLHASGKIGTLGVIGLCIGVAILMPQATFKVLTLAIFLIFSNPVASHAIAAGVHRYARTINERAEAEQAKPVVISGIHRLSDLRKQEIENTLDGSEGTAKS